MVRIFKKIFMNFLLAVIIFTLIIGCSKKADTPLQPMDTIPSAQPPEPPLAALSETSQQASDNERFTAQNTYNTEYETSKGYKLTASLSIGNWIKSSDENAVALAWGSIGGQGAPPSLDGLGDKYRKDKSVVAFGTLTINNNTPGWDITSTYPLDINLNFGIMNGVSYRYNALQMYLDNTNGGRYAQIVEWRAIVGAQMTSNKWGPLRFMMILPDVFSPNTPDGDDKLDELVVLSWGAYTSGSNSSVKFNIEKSWEPLKQESDSAQSAPEDLTAFDVGTAGNTPGNIVNEGFVAMQGDKIYYLSGYETLGGLIHVMNADGSGKTKLSDDKASNINVVGNKIYYRVLSGKGELYVMNTDGSDRTMLLYDEYTSRINVVDNKIYYIKGSIDLNNNDTLYEELYVVNTDGSGKVKLTDDEPNFINVVGGRIYYANENDDERMYVVNTDGSGRMKLNDDRAMYINVVGGRVYYTNLSDNGKLYVINIDGSGRMKLNDDSSWNLNVAGDKIYYTNGSDNDKLYVINTDGSGRMKLNDDKSDYINIAGNIIFYRNGSDGYKCYIINTDGTGRRLFD